MKLGYLLGGLGVASAFTSQSSVYQRWQPCTTALNYRNNGDVEDTKKPKREKVPDPMSFGRNFASSGMTSAAAIAAAAVNAAVAMKTLEAPDVDKSYVALNTSKAELDEEGLPLTYDKDMIEAYWSKERGALNQRWGYFVGKAVPFLTKLSTLFFRDGKIVDSEVPGLAEQACKDLQDLGPTFIKAGQMMSVRPDILPQPALDELSKLQDSVVPFDTKVAVEQIEQELGGPLGKFFTSISEEPVAAASLAQVYLATLNDGKNTKVAVKIQRPNVLGVVSKDLYVLRRAAEVFQGLVEKFAPNQRTNYVALLNEWAIGFYTELDFSNEARNQKRLRDTLIEKNIQGITVPEVFDELCTRRLLVSEWMDGKKLSEVPTEEIARVTPVAQEAFLTQLFEVGFFHADPHPGNILLLNEPTEEGHQLALIDCGLMASIAEGDRDHMISALIHLANKDYTGFVEDCVKLQIFPTDVNKGAIIPLLDKALSPYVKGGGAKKYEAAMKKAYGFNEEIALHSQVGGFQAMTQDVMTVLNDVPFSIPPYFAILGRAIVALEGVALTGNPEYGIIMEAYPFIARKLLSEDRPEIQSALQQVLYSGEATDKGLKMSRLLALLNNAAGAVATQEGATFVDFDAVPEDGISFKELLKFILSDQAGSLRVLLEKEMDSIVDVLSRQIMRKAMSEAVVALTPPKPPSVPFLGDIFPPTPELDEIKLPMILQGRDGIRKPISVVISLKELTDAVAPKLSQDEELFALSLADAAKEFLGEDVAAFAKGEDIFSAKSGELILAMLRSGFLARTDMLSPEAVDNIVNIVSSHMSMALGSASFNTRVETELTEAISNLDDVESTRLKEITKELIKRAIARMLDRVSSLE